MGDEFEPDQLVEFCQRLGLGNDGYLNEQELGIVCNCIGLQAPEEMLKELFETLDTDKDGRVDLNELTQMLKGGGMPKSSPSSSPKKSNFNESSKNPSTSSSSKPPLPPRPDFSSSSAASSSSNGDHFHHHPHRLLSSTNSTTISSSSTFSILDPNSSGFTKCGSVLDMWSSWGIPPQEGLSILAELGFPFSHSSSPRTSSINVSDLSKALEEETDSAKESLPLLLQTALLTYKSESQYLRSICESMEGERDKLRQDVSEAHARSTFLAQEVDEQNARLEKNSQLLLAKMESRYSEQISELQAKFTAEKEFLQSTLGIAENQLKSLQGNDTRLKGTINKLQSENSSLERELVNLNKEIRTLHKAKSSLEQEIDRYVDLENKLGEIERHHSESSALAEAKLVQASQEVTALRDQNDELSTQIEIMREKVKTLKAFQEKKSATSNKRRKGSATSGSKSLDEFGVIMGNNRDDGGGTDNENEYPVEKMGKFHLGHDDSVTLFSDEVEELESSSLGVSQSQPDSGSFPMIINLAPGCLGETSTDSISSMAPTTTTTQTQQNVINKSFQQEMERETILVMDNNRFCSLKAELDQSKEISSSKSEEVGTQTQEQGEKEGEQQDVEMHEDNNNPSSISELLSRIAQLEADAAASEKERQELRDHCSELNSSLELLREEYDKCEDYWSDKLSEAREIYEGDKSQMDEKFQDLLYKIKEYEDSFMSSNSYPMTANRLPPIDERASLETQVNELEEECQELRRELRSIKIEHDSMLSNYHRQWETLHAKEESGLEQQVEVLRKKCHEYESRLSSLAEAEQGQSTTLDEPGLIEMLRERVKSLEFQITHQEDTFRAQITQLEQRVRTKNKKNTTDNVVVVDQPQAQPPQVWNNNSTDATDLNGRNLLELLHQKKEISEEPPDEATTTISKEKNDIPATTTTTNRSAEPASSSIPVVSVSPFLIWPQRYAHPAPVDINKCASLPFIPVASEQPYQQQQPSWNNPGNQQQHQQFWNNPSYQNQMNQQAVFGDPWSSIPHNNNNIYQQHQYKNQPYNNNHNKKAWCHVELGWLTALRSRLRQREDQVQSLQHALKRKELEMDNVIRELNAKHESDAKGWKQVLTSSQEMIQSQAQRIIQLDNLLKYHMNQQQQPSSSFSTLNNTNSPRSLPFHHPNQQTNFFI